MLRWRLLLGTVLIAAVAGLVWLDHHAGGGRSVAAARCGGVGLSGHGRTAATLRPRGPETAGLERLHRQSHGDRRGLGAAGARATCAVSIQRPSRWPRLCLAVFALFLDEVRRFEKPGGITGNVAAGVLTLVYVGGLFAVLVHLRMLFGPLALITFIVVVKMGDTGAYTVGRLIGRHKMAPALSPGKTIEGAFGHLAFACLGAWLCLVLLVPAFGVTTGRLVAMAGRSGWSSGRPAWLAIWPNRCSNATSAARTRAPGCPASAACSTCSTRSCWPRPWAGSRGLCCCVTLWPVFDRATLPRAERARSRRGRPAEATARAAASSESPKKRLPKLSP